jgi:7-cyano-7-deazaguanine synthase in queuosine biosynthesis
VYADDWPRMFHLVVPVEDLEHWTRRDVQAALIDAVEFATGDRFAFTFEQGTPGQYQLPLHHVGHSPEANADVVTLFSGGLDSLGAVIDQVVNEKRRPVLVSHRSVARIDARQQALVRLLKERLEGWSFPHVSIWAHRRIERAAENTQRSRAFLYLSMATAVAAEAAITDIRICDNGIMSINLPRLAQTVGTMATRSTHPMFLEKFEGLARLTFDPRLAVTNTFLNKTRVEVVQIIRDSGHPELIQEAVSCARTEGMTEFQPHCGTCTQCVDRRFATTAAGVEQHDLPTRYQKDVFSDPLEDGDERTYAVGFVRAATDFTQLSDDEFFLRFPELQECIDSLPGPPNRAARDLIELHRRHGKTALHVLHEKTNELWDRLVDGRLPESCLVALTNGREHLKDSRAACAKRLGQLFAENVPKAFRGRRAKNEVEVQNVADAVLGAAHQQLRRESPVLPFGAITTKPDFSDEVQNPLFVEMKYPKTRQALRRVVTEMTSRVTVYRSQGASLLFPVYDPNHTIRDDDEFRSPFEKHEGVWVAVFH